MEGVITVQDTRQTVDSMKEWRNEAAKTISGENTNTLLSTIIDVTKIAVGIVGAVATVVAGVAATPVASPIVAKAALAVSGALEGAKAIVKGQNSEEGLNTINAAIVGFTGGIKDISIKDKDIAKPVEVQPVQPSVMQNTPINMVK